LKNGINGCSTGNAGCFKQKNNQISIDGEKYARLFPKGAVEGCCVR
jgi:hypothetical protein